MYVLPFYFKPLWLNTSNNRSSHPFAFHHKYVHIFDVEFVYFNMKKPLLMEIECSETQN